MKDFNRVLMVATSGIESDYKPVDYHKIVKSVPRDKLKTDLSLTLKKNMMAIYDIERAPIISTTISRSLVKLLLCQLSKTFKGLSYHHKEKTITFFMKLLKIANHSTVAKTVQQLADFLRINIVLCYYDNTEKIFKNVTGQSTAKIAIYRDIIGDFYIINSIFTDSIEPSQGLKIESKQTLNSETGDYIEILNLDSESESEFSNVECPVSRCKNTNLVKAIAKHYTAKSPISPSRVVIKICKRCSEKLSSKLRIVKNTPYGLVA